MNLVFIADENALRCKSSSSSVHTACHDKHHHMLARSLCSAATVILLCSHGLAPCGTYVLHPQGPGMDGLRRLLRYQCLDDVVHVGCMPEDCRVRPKPVNNPVRKLQKLDLNPRISCSLDDPLRRLQNLDLDPRIPCILNDPVRRCRV